LYEIHIKDLRLRAIIGVLDFERVERQNILVELVCQYENKEKYIDYMQIVAFIKESFLVKEYLLIEDAIDDITKSLKEKYQNIKQTTLFVSKLDILENGVVCVSG